jgi:hypothetical protein
MPGTKRTLFDPARFLEAAGVTHRMVQVNLGMSSSRKGALQMQYSFSIRAEQSSP